MSNYPLFKEIIKLSHSPEWVAAKGEWKFLAGDYIDEGTTCLCGHYPIKDVTFIKNQITNNVARIGNCCIKRFDNKTDNNILKSILKIKGNVDMSINKDCLNCFYENNLLNDNEYQFYFKIRRKRKLSEKQQEWKRKINKKILEFYYKIKYDKLVNKLPANSP